MKLRFCSMSRKSSINELKFYLSCLFIAVTASPRHGARHHCAEPYEELNGASCSIKITTKKNINHVTLNWKQKEGLEVGEAFML